MKIGVAQTRSVPGDIAANIEKHLRMIDLAAREDADSILFPELSLTGYDSKLAGSLAINADDSSLDIFQKVSDEKRMTLFIGMPTKSAEGVRISLLIFQPGEARSVYSKRYLHADEHAWFAGGTEPFGPVGENPRVGLAICYEISVDRHMQETFANGAEIYLASVAKYAEGMDQAFQRLSAKAASYSAPILMANCVGLADGKPCAGRSAAWDDQGILVGELDGENEGLLVFDTRTQKADRHTMKS